MSERNWQLSLDAERDPKIQHLARLTSGVVEYTRHDDSVVTQLSRYENTFDGGIDVDKLFEGFTESEFHQQLTVEQKLHVTRVLNATPENAWRYGNAVHKDALWDYEGPVISRPFEPIDAAILTGLAGAELLGKSKRLDRYAEVLEPDLLKRAVLMGGVALVMASRRSWQTSVSYQGVSRNGLVSETDIGGTLHGDFFTDRRQRFDHDAISPLGERLPFAPPTNEHVYIAAYHSTEPRIMAAILAYQTSYKQIERHALHDSLAANVSAHIPSSGGAFADYGDGDGEREGFYLRALINKGVAEGDVLDRLTVYPGDFETKLVLTARAEGIEFANTSKHGETMRRFILPAEEVEDYVATLLASNYGRTSKAALMAVIYALLRTDTPLHPSAVKALRELQDHPSYER